MMHMQTKPHFHECANQKQRKTALSAFLPWFCSLGVKSDTNCRGSLRGPALKVQQQILPFIGDGSSEHALGQQVLVYVLEDS